MWSKLLEVLFRFIGLPLIMKLVEGFRYWWNNKKATEKLEKEIDEAVTAIEQSKSEEEQKDALKKFVEGVRRRRSS